MTTIVYVCLECDSEVFWYHLKERKTKLGEIVTPISFTAVSNCDSCANWLNHNFHIKTGLFAMEGIGVQNV